MKEIAISTFMIVFFLIFLFNVLGFAEGLTAADSFSNPCIHKKNLKLISPRLSIRLLGRTIRMTPEEIRKKAECTELEIYRAYAKCQFDSFIKDDGTIDREFKSRVLGIIEIALTGVWNEAIEGAASKASEIAILESRYYEGIIFSSVPASQIYKEWKDKSYGASKAAEKIRSLKLPTEGEKS